MATDRTAEESKQHYVERMGEELGSLFHALWNEVAWLYIKWGEYIELFGAKPSRIELLNQVAPLFFKVVEDSLWEDTLLHIARLTDRPHFRDKKNLTIHLLKDLVTEEKVAATLANLIEVAIKKADFCRDWRNRHIAHRDLPLAMNEGAKPLEPASRLKAKEALEAIAAVLNAISIHYTATTIEFDMVSRHQGAISMLDVLDDGLQAEKERQERWNAGEYRSDDHKPRDL